MKPAYFTRYRGGPLDTQTVPWPDTNEWPPTERQICFWTTALGWVPINDDPDALRAVDELLSEFPPSETERPVIYHRVSMSPLADDAAEHPNLVRGAQYEYAGHYGG